MLPSLLLSGNEPATWILYFGVVLQPAGTFQRQREEWIGSKSPNSERKHKTCKSDEKEDGK